MKTNSWTTAGQAKDISSKPQSLMAAIAMTDVWAGAQSWLNNTPLLSFAWRLTLLCFLDCLRSETYSWLSLSRTRFSRITAYLEVKIWSLPKYEHLTIGRKYCGKEEKLLLRSNFSSFPQYFQYISNFKSYSILMYLLNVVVRIIFS